MGKVRKEIRLEEAEIKALEKLARGENHSVKSYIEKIVKDHLLRKKIKED